MASCLHHYPSRALRVWFLSLLVSESDRIILDRAASNVSDECQTQAQAGSTAAADVRALLNLLDRLLANTAPLQISVLVLAFRLDLAVATTRS